MPFDTHIPSRSDIRVMPAYFDRYITLVPNMALLQAMELYIHFSSLIPPEQLEALADLRYAPGKWTVKDILQHIIDTERIMSYRALRFARNDRAELPGYDENLFAQHTTAKNRTVEDLLDELVSVRESSMWMFRHLTNEMLQRTGICNGNRISVLALGFVIVGHAIHHANIIRERYTPLL